MERATAAFDARKFREASIEVRSALASDPDNAEARLLAARIHLEFGDGKAAQIELEKAESQGLDAQRLVIPKLTALMLQDKYDAVLNKSAAAVASFDALGAGEKASVLALAAVAYLALDEVEKAQNNLRRALQIDPENPKALVARAQIALRDGDFDSAETSLLKAIEADPEHAPAYSLLGHYHRHFGRHDDAEAAFTRAIELRVTNIDDLLARAITRHRKGDLEGMRGDIATLKSKGAVLPQARYAEGILAFGEGQYETAVDAFEEVVAEFSNYIKAVCYLGMSLAIEERPARAATHLKTCSDFYPGSDEIRIAYASVVAALGETRAARTALAPLVARAQSDELQATGNEADARLSKAIELLANVEAMAGNADRAAALMREYVEREQGSGTAYLKLGSVLAAVGQTRDAQSAFDQATAIDSDLPSHILKAETFLNQGMPLQAIEALEESEAGYETEYSLNLLGIANGQIGDNAKARTMFERALTLNPEYDIAALNLAKMEAKSGDPARALELVENILLRQPGNVRALAMALALDFQKGRLNDALERIDRAASADLTDPAEFLVLRARFERSRRRFDEAIAYYTTLIEQHGEREGWLREKALTERDAGKIEQAVATLKATVEIAANPAPDLLLLSNMLTQAGDEDSARRALERALAVAPDNPAVRLAELEILVKEEKAAAARQKLNALKELVGSDDDPMILAAEGWVSLLEGDGQQAIAALEKALARDDSLERAVELATAHAQLGDASMAIRVLEQWSTAHPGDEAAVFKLADAHDKLGYPSEAIKLYEALLERRPDHVSVLNNLAWLLRTRDAERALGYARRAAELVPESPRILDTLGVILADTGEYDSAIEHLRRAASGAPDRPTIRLHLAQALVRAGMTAEARRTLNGIDSSSMSEDEKRDFEALASDLRG